MGNFITITTNGVDVKDAKGNQILLSSQYPLMKLDRNNTASFQNIVIFFNNEPPTPTANNSTTTLVYQFKHGYTYTPSVWSFCRADGVTIKGVVGSTYFTDSGLIGGNDTSGGTSFAQLKVGYDDTSVYIYVIKYTGPLGVPTNIIGASLSFRFYIFAEDLLGNSVPSHA